MNYGKVIGIADKFADNDLDSETKRNMLFRFECQVLTEVYMLSQVEIALLPAPTDETELTIPRPYEAVYWLWLVCRIHEANRDGAELANATVRFNDEWSAFVQFHARTVNPADGGAEKKGYYLSAYAIAVQNGYIGTVSEWLASLKGDKGDAYAIAESDYAEIAAYVAEHYDAKIAEVNAAVQRIEAADATAKSGDEPDVSVTVDENGMHFAFTLEKGKQGDPGKDGKTPVKGVDYNDGFSPVVTVEDISGGHRVTVTDKNREQVFDVMDGKKGDTGKQGDKGDDGISPTVDVKEIEGGHRVTIADKNGMKKFNVMDGEDGVAEFATFEIVDGELYAITTDDLHTAFSLNNGHLEVTIE